MQGTFSCLLVCAALGIIAGNLGRVVGASKTEDEDEEEDIEEESPTTIKLVKATTVSAPTIRIDPGPVTARMLPVVHPTVPPQPIRPVPPVATTLAPKPVASNIIGKTDVKTTLCPVCNTTHMLDPINFPAFDEVKQKYGVTKQICGKKYFISNKRYTGQSIAKMCCDIGMWSVSIATLQEQNCITSFFKNNNPPYIFWTSAFRSGTQPGAFRWCGNVNREISNYEKLRWFPGEPNNKDGSESCIALSATPTKENLFDLNCDTTLNMICEDALPGISMHSLPINTSPVDCERLGSCKSFLTRDRNVSSNAMVIKKNGVISFSCDHVYLFSHYEMNARDASDLCCELGMWLVSPESFVDFLCLSSVLRAKFSVGSWWTSGQSTGPSSTRWCGRDPKPITLDLNNPERNRGDRSCVRLDVNATTSHLVYADCELLSKFVCMSEDNRYCCNVK